MRTFYIGKSKPSDSSCFMWNMIGSTIFALSSLILSVFVIRITGSIVGGMFSIALTISQMLMFIAFFEMRNYQVTDAKCEYTFSDYHTAKVVMCIVMGLVSILYVLFMGYNLEKAIIVLLACLYRMFDGYADVYESQFQIEGRLDLAGKSMTFRTLFSIAVLMVCLLVSNRLLYALIAGNVAAFVGVFLCNVLVINQLRVASFKRVWRSSKKIIQKCFPLFVGVFCWGFILSASRIAIDWYMEYRYQSYFILVFLPVSAINLFGGFVFRPLLPKLTIYYKEKQDRLFWRIIGKGILLLTLFTLFSMVVAFFWGIPILSIISGLDLSGYRGILVFLVMSGGLNAIGYTLYLILTIMRGVKRILIGYITTAILSLITAFPMVRIFGLSGAAGSYFLSVLVLSLLFFFLIRLQIRNAK